VTNLLSGHGVVYTFRKGVTLNVTSITHTHTHTYARTYTHIFSHILGHIQNATLSYFSPFSAWDAQMQREIDRKSASQRSECVCVSACCV